MPEGFAVLLADPEQLRSPLIAETLAKHERIPFADAARRSHTTWGMLLESAPKAQAEALAGALSAAGIKTLLVPQDRLAPLDASSKAASAVFKDASSLWTTKPQGLVVEIPNADLTVIAAAAYRNEVIRTVKVIEGPTASQRMASLGIQMATGLPIHIGGKEREVEKTEKSTDLAFQLELIGGSPARRILVDPADFNFDCLGARMQYGSFPNFRSLLGAVRERAPNARLTLGARTLLAGQQISRLGYDSPADLEREERWLLALSALK